MPSFQKPMDAIINESSNAQAQTCKKSKSAYKFQNTKRWPIAGHHDIRQKDINIVSHNSMGPIQTFWSITIYDSTKRYCYRGKIVKPRKHVEN
jgi:hypothetical protein